MAIRQSIEYPRILFKDQDEAAKAARQTCGQKQANRREMQEGWTGSAGSSGGGDGGRNVSMTQRIDGFKKGFVSLGPSLAAAA